MPPVQGRRGCWFWTAASRRGTRDTPRGTAARRICNPLIISILQAVLSRNPGSSATGPGRATPDWRWSRRSVVAGVYASREIRAAFTREARSAGSQQAKRQMTQMVTITSAYVAGSCGGTPNRRPAMMRPSTNAPARPMATPSNRRASNPPRESSGGLCRASRRGRRSSSARNGCCARATA